MPSITGHVGTGAGEGRGACEACVGCIEAEDCLVELGDIGAEHAAAPFLGHCSGGL